MHASRSFCFLNSLNHLPLATGTAIVSVVPLAVVAGGVVAYGDLVSARGWSTVGVGFVGMLLIVRPTAEGINGYAALTLAAVCFFVVRDLATRRLGSVPSTMVAMCTASAITPSEGRIEFEIELPLLPN